MTTIPTSRVLARHGLTQYMVDVHRPAFVLSCTANEASEARVLDSRLDPKRLAL